MDPRLSNRLLAKLYINLNSKHTQSLFKFDLVIIQYTFCLLFYSAVAYSDESLNQFLALINICSYKFALLLVETIPQYPPGGG